MNPRAVQVHDRRLGPLWFPADDEVVAPRIAKSGMWEPLEGLWLDLVVQPGMTVVNVGANVGYFALCAAQLVGPAGRVIAIEPHPGNCALLRRNVADRGLGDIVHVVEAAASADSGTVTLYMNEHNYGDHRVYEPKRDTATAALSAQAAGFSDQPHTATVPSIRLDDLCVGRRVDVIFSDAQGWDHQVLRGAREILRTDAPVALFEFAPEWIEGQGEDAHAVVAELMDSGYAIGAWDAGCAPGEWPVSELVSWVRQHWFSNLELWPLRRPLVPRVRPTTGFWPLERDGPHDRFWLIRESGLIRLAGPPGWMGRLRATLIPPARHAAVLDLAGRRVDFDTATPVDWEVELDETGVAEWPIAALTPLRHPGGDPRPLYAALLDPRLHQESGQPVQPRRASAERWRRNHS